MITVIIYVFEFNEILHRHELFAKKMSTNKKKFNSPLTA